MIYTDYLLATLIKSGGLGDAPLKTEYYTPHKTITIGIGDDHTATLVLDEMALEELNKRTGIDFGMNDES